MPIDLHLAMTGAEIETCNRLPPHIGWMACHFSLSGPGLSNLPKKLPQHAILILDDSIPFADHQPEIITQQLQETIHTLQVEAVILDFQRGKHTATQNLAYRLQSELPCPVAAPPEYSNGQSPVFLPPCPPNRLLKDHLMSFWDREIWLEIALDCMQISITEKGSHCEFLSPENTEALYHQDQKLHCHYRISQTSDTVAFTLHRTWDDLQELLGEADHLGVNHAIGLWQELKK